MRRSFKDREGIKLTIRKANILFSVLVIVGCIVFGYMAIWFDNPLAMAGSQVPTQVFPILVLSFIAICSALNAVNDLRQSNGAGGTRAIDLSKADLWRVVLIVAVMILSCFLWTRFGFIAASVVMCPAIAASMRVRSVPIYLGLAAFGPLTWVVFVHVLNVNL